MRTYISVPFLSCVSCRFIVPVSVNNCGFPENLMRKFSCFEGVAKVNKCRLSIIILFVVDSKCQRCKQRDSKMNSVIWYVVSRSRSNVNISLM